MGNPVSEWIDKRFFIKAPKPRVLILLISAAISIAFTLWFSFLKRMDSDFFLNKCGYLSGKLIGIVATIIACFVSFALLSGIYNVLSGIYSLIIRRIGAGRR
ncbi:MAG: hypothetical protein WCN95_12230 [bacterium]